MGEPRQVESHVLSHQYLHLASLEAVYRRYAIVSSEDLRDAVRRLESGDGYTSGYTQPSSRPASKRIVQKILENRIRRDGRVVDGGGLENH